ncbi:hypothetical protein HX109_14865 [Galbibacter sp. BG1]|uniref:hypothetical protein n=1 Tax=Galbibacter sp. BG1 TaxID=1170699 RepID=UPI0015B97C68|nr:hypothetical protein [Galbibacter sp. BG1]QLE02783.1 hypothetical protein HX109_14865 [Galbibacter sp. BG1]
MKNLDSYPTRSRFLKHRILSIGSIVALLIAISPYLYYLYESFPESKVWDTMLFKFEAQKYGSLYLYAWFFLGKFVPLMLLTLWFFTCKHWWYHVILIPISMYFFQLLSVINDDVQYLDEFEIYYIIPIMMVVIPIVYFIRIKLIDKYIHGIDLDKIDAELKEYEEKEKVQQKKNKFF